MIILIFSVTAISAADLNNTHVSVIKCEDDSLSVDNNILKTDDGKNTTLDIEASENNPDSNITVEKPRNNITLDIKGPNLNSTPEIKGPKIVGPFPKIDIVGTFKDLQDEINKAPAGSVLDLYRDYISKDNSIVNIDKDLIINGHGHTLECSYLDYCQLHSDKGNIVLKNLRFCYDCGDRGYSCKDGDGGAIYIAGSAQYTLDNCTFEHVWADSDGGVIYNDVNKALTIKNCAFYSNGCLQCNGGVIYSKGNVYIDNSLFDSNQAQKGGAIYSSSAVYIDGSTFKDNYALDCGGAVYAKTVNVNINQNSTQPFNSFFINNHVKNDDAGAIYVEEGVNIVNSQFNGNYALVDGGAIFSKANVNVKHCLFENNKANGARSSCYGGAIRAKEVLTVDNSTFKNNYAENKGGAVYASKVILKPSPSYFESNAARDYGGAIYTDKFDEDVSHISFINNKAENDDGGAIYIDCENWITFTDCVFLNNHCKDEGGAIYLDSKDAHLTLKNNVFIGNSADEGQAVYNCGVYKEVNNNFWGGKNPSTSNDVLIEWKPLFVPNVHHVDSNPLKKDFVLDKYSDRIFINSNVIRESLTIDLPFAERQIKVTFNLYNEANGKLYDGDAIDINNASFDIDPRFKVVSKEIDKNTVTLKLITQNMGPHNINVNFYGRSLSFTFNIVYPLFKGVQIPD